MASTGILQDSKCKKQADIKSASFIVHKSFCFRLYYSLVKRPGYVSAGSSHLPRPYVYSAL